MPLYLVAPILAVLAVLQSTLVPLLPLGNLRPDLILVVVLGWGAVSNSRDAVAWGLVGGLALDILTGLPFGLHAVTLGVVGLIADLLGVDFFRSNIVTPLITAFIATMLYYAMALALLQVSGRAVDWPVWMARIVLPAALVNTLLMPFALLLLQRLLRTERAELRV